MIPARDACDRIEAESERPDHGLTWSHTLSTMSAMRTLDSSWDLSADLAKLAEVQRLREKRKVVRSASQGVKSLASCGQTSRTGTDSRRRVGGHSAASIKGAALTSISPEMSLGRASRAGRGGCVLVRRESTNSITVPRLVRIAATLAGAQNGRADGYSKET